MGGAMSLWLCLFCIPQFLKLSTSHYFPIFILVFKNPLKNKKNRALL